MPLGLIGWVGTREGCQGISMRPNMGVHSECLYRILLKLSSFYRPLGAYLLAPTLRINTVTTTQAGNKERHAGWEMVVLVAALVRCLWFPMLSHC